MQIRNRIKELRHIRAGDLRPHPKNWRKHPEAQQNRKVFLMELDPLYCDVIYERYERFTGKRCARLAACRTAA